MNKSLRYCFALLLTAVMLAGNTVTAYAASDSNSGPGVAYQEQPQDNTANTETNAQSDTGTAGQDTTAGQNTTDNQTAAEGGEAHNAEAAADVAEEAAAAAAEAAAQANNPMSVPNRVPHLQTTVLLQNGQWSRPFVNDETIYNDGTTFISISIFLTEIIGNIHYRAYTSAGGWTPWAMNGQQTTITTLEDSQLSLIHI